MPLLEKLSAELANNEDALKTIFVSSPRLKILEIPNLPLQPFLSNSQYRQLTSLRLHVETEIDPILSILDCCSSLETFEQHQASAKLLPRRWLP